MNEMLKAILSLSCSGALLIVILRLLRPLFRTRLSKQWQHYIWLVVILRLLFPFTLEINLMGTLFQGIDKRMVPSESVLFSGQEAPAMPALLDSAGGRLQENLLEQQPDDEAGMGAVPKERPEAWIWNGLWWCWLATALALLIRKITTYQCFVKYIQAGCVEADDIALLERFGRLVEESKVKTPVELYTNSLISSPLLIGFFRPCIVLPTDKLSDTAFQYTILHELTHWKRRDMFYKWLVQLTVCLHWFNPLVHLMSREVERACELSCDEAVIKTLTPRERRDYGDALLNAMEHKGTYKNTLASLALGESRKQLSERLDAITGFRKKSKSVRLAAAALTTAVCLGAAAGGAYASPLSSLEGTSPAKPPVIGALTLTEKEYTLDELEKSGISRLSIAAHSDDVSVVRGGDTLKFEYYALNPDEYLFMDIPFESLNYREDYVKEPCQLAVFRSPSDVGRGRSMAVTLPEQYPIDLNIKTTSGNISLADCVARSIITHTQNGRIDIRGGSVFESFSVNTQTGDAFISGTALPDREKTTFASQFYTVSGTMIFQPPDRAEHYSLAVDYGEEAEIFINHEGIEPIDMLDGGDTEITSYPDGTVSSVETEDRKKLAFTLNEGAPKEIRFHSLKGTLMIQDK